MPPQMHENYMASEGTGQLGTDNWAPRTIGR